MHQSQNSLIYLGPDISDSTTFKRCNEFANLGMNVTSYTFKRTADTILSQPTWTAIIIANITHGRSLARLVGMARLLVKIGANRKLLHQTDVIYARNLDMAFAALIIKTLFRSKAVIAYEVLDVHRKLTGNGLLACSLRFIERIVLMAADLLVVSSPGFLENHFRVHYKRLPDIFLLENRILPVSAIDVSVFRNREFSVPRAFMRPIRVGWFGRLRCLQSLRLIEQIAANSRGKIHFVIAGIPATFSSSELKAITSRHSNIEYLGSYYFPTDLPKLYEQVHVNWCIAIDRDAKTNSAWLLPNRIYEGGFFSVPALGLANTEIGRYLEENEAGWVVTEASASQVEATLSGISDESYNKVVTHLSSVPENKFVGSDDHRELVNTLLAHRRSSRP